ncbi:MAG: hypothetical protein IIW33_02565 [Oscillospiraceae bacterium]|nr:hypothetical protein [Oscillospiraceae bacterium]
MGRRRQCLFGRALLYTGLVILMLTFCSFRFICTTLAVIFVIAGIRLLLCR